MAKGYRPVDRGQPFLFPPDMREWLLAGHAVWLVIEAVRRLDGDALEVAELLGHRYRRRQDVADHRGPAGSAGTGRICRGEPGCGRPGRPAQRRHSRG